jgi:hypothetical protein
MLEAKGYNPQVNVIDKQATKFIKKNLTEKGCTLQLVEQHNHQVNGAECTIQTFKEAFIHIGHHQQQISPPTMG